jgi:hypothetical protein
LAPLTFIDHLRSNENKISAGLAAFFPVSFHSQIEGCDFLRELPSEQKWYALIGRGVDSKVEADGDIHIALQDANGDGVGTVLRMLS